MRGFFEKVRTTAGDIFNRAGDKASELVEIRRLRKRISLEQKTVQSAKRELVRYCMEQHRAESLEDDTLVRICDEIRKHEDMIEDLQDLIELEKDAYK